LCHVVSHFVACHLVLRVVINNECEANLNGQAELRGFAQILRGGTGLADFSPTQPPLGFIPKLVKCVSCFVNKVGMHSWEAGLSGEGLAGWYQGLLSIIKCGVRG
jgi:hypothetical protein